VPVHPCYCLNDGALALIEAEGQVLVIDAWLEDIWTQTRGCGSHCEKEREKERCYWLSQRGNLLWVTYTLQNHSKNDNICLLRKKDNREGEREREREMCPKWAKKTAILCYCISARSTLLFLDLANCMNSKDFFKCLDKYLGPMIMDYIIKHASYMQLPYTLTSLLGSLWCYVDMNNIQ
jgi:hypothetical protein